MTAPRRRSPAPPIAPSIARIIKPTVTRPKAALIVRRIRGMGRGVFAGRRFRKGELIEVCPVIPLTRTQTRKCGREILDRYIFQWPRSAYPSAVVLGLGSLYNHSHVPNARFIPRVRTDDMVFRAARDIEPGEQILVNYEWPERDYHFPVGAKFAASRER